MKPFRRPSWASLAALYVCVPAGSKVSHKEGRSEDLAGACERLDVAGALPSRLYFNATPMLEGTVSDEIHARFSQVNIVALGRPPYNRR
jgi:hypothetical protein